MARKLTPRLRRRFQWVTGLLLIAAGCTQPLVTAAAAAPPIPAGEARIWFYQYETRTISRALIPTIVANGTYVGPAPPGTVLYRDVAPGHYDITIPNRSGFKYGSGAHFDLVAGQQAFVKIVFFGGSYHLPWQHTPGFGALLVPEQVAQAEFAYLIPDGGQR
jgi:hypothetical protein